MKIINLKDFNKHKIDSIIERQEPLMNEICSIYNDLCKQVDNASPEELLRLRQEFFEAMPEAKSKLFAAYKEAVKERDLALESNDFILIKSLNTKVEELFKLMPKTLILVEPVSETKKDK